ncbi:MAG: hypothetical protein SVS15_03810 [Thermodesulfobacteriota bacterium]|nr:hypothetical protein [Thermodesulfobacteriota bacterium]
MKPRKNSFLCILLFLLAFTCGCEDMGGKTADVLWPGLTGPYARLARQWTRKDAVYSGIDTEFTAVATLKSWAWREGFSRRHAKTHSLSAQEAAKFLEDQRRAHAGSSEIVLSLSSPKPEYARLKSKDPLWSVFVVQGEKKTYPMEIRPMEKDLWPAGRLQVFFPDFKPWQKFYCLRFAPFKSGPVTLVVSGPPGRVEFFWERNE